MSDVARGKAEHLAAVQENERLRVALSKLTNGFKYPSEVCRVAREALQVPPAETSEQPKPHGVVYDKPGWICSVCGFWNNIKDRHCAGIHLQSDSGSEKANIELSPNEAATFGKTLARSPRRIPSRDADHCDYPDCEHHWTLVVDMALAAMKALHESAEPDENHPDIPAVIPAAAFRAFVDEHARLMRIRASGAVQKASEHRPPCDNPHCCICDGPAQNGAV